MVSDARTAPRTDEEIERIYSTGKSQSHVEALRAVYEAGRKHDEWAIDQRHLTEDQRVAAEHARVVEEKRTAAVAKLSPEDKRAADEKEKLERERADAKAKTIEQKHKADEKLRLEDEKRAERRIAAVEKGHVDLGEKPTPAQVNEARAAALKRAKNEGLTPAQQETVQDEAEAELIASMARGVPA